MRRVTVCVLCVLLCCLVLAACSKEYHFMEPYEQQDQEPPQLTLTSLSNGQEVGTNILISGTVSDNDSGVADVIVTLMSSDGQVSNQAGASLDGNSYRTEMAVTRMGHYSVLVSACDRCTNRASLLPVQVLVARVPEVRITSPAQSWAGNQTTCTLEGTTAVLPGDSIQRVLVQVNGTAPQQATKNGADWSSWSYTALSLHEGTNILEVYAESALGKTSQIHSRSYMRDTVAPTCVISSPGQGQTLTSGDVTVITHAGDTNSGLADVRISVDGGGWQAVAADYTNQHTLGGGSHTLRIYAVDQVGNYSLTQQTTFLVDSDQPSIAISQPASGIWTNNNTIIVAGQATTGPAGLDTVYCQQGNNSPVSSSSAGFQFTMSGALGANEFKVYCRDNVGRYSPTNVVTVNVDTTVPVCNFSGSSPADGQIYHASSQSLTYYGTVSDTPSNSLDTVRVRIRETDGTLHYDGTASMNSGNWQFTHVLQAPVSRSFQVQVWALDKAGNQSVTVTRTVHVMNSTVFASTSGNDSYEGTRTRPKRRIDAAIALTSHSLINEVRVSGNYRSGSTLDTGDYGLQISLGNLTLRGGYNSSFSSTSGRSELDGVNMVEHVVFASGVNNVTLDGFVVKRGDAHSAAAIKDGGGIHFAGDSLTIRNCTIEHNKAFAKGGGIYFNGQHLNLENCHVDTNVAAYGGGLYLLDANAGGAYKTINGTFSRNYGSYAGGGILVNDGRGYIFTGTIENNWATVNGGGIQIMGGDVYTIDCSVHHNHTTQGSGAGIYLINCGTQNYPVIVKNIIYNNYASFAAGGGGGLHHENAVWDNQVNVWSQNQPSNHN